MIETITQACSQHSWAILTMLGTAFGFGRLLGYLLWNKYKQQVDDLSLDLANWKTKYSNKELAFANLTKDHDKLSGEFGALRGTYATLEDENLRIRKDLDECLSSRQALELDLNSRLDNGINANLGAGAAGFAAGVTGAAMGSNSISINEELQANYALLQQDYATAQEDIADLRAKLAACEAKDNMLAPAEITGDLVTSSKYAGVIANDNLQIVEGIGPVMNRLLNEHGIKTWSDLGKTSPDAIKAILAEHGTRYQIINPDTWPKQALLAAQGQFEELIQYQKFLDTGVESKGDFVTDSKFEKLVNKSSGIKAKKPTDLKIIEGIGPKSEEVLKDAGLNTWSDVAQKSAEEIREMLDGAGMGKMHDPSTWPKQAELAASGKWEELQEYQDFLDGGRD